MSWNAVIDGNLTEGGTSKRSIILDTNEFSRAVCEGAAILFQQAHHAKQDELLEQDSQYRRRESAIEAFRVSLEKLKK